MTEGQNILAVIQRDLQLICGLRDQLGANGFPSLNIARNSEEAVLYLRGVGIYSDRSKSPLPSILILDCDNDDGSDLQVLSWVREQGEFRDLPIILLCGGHHATHHVSCALDHSCFLLERDRLDEVVDGVRNARHGELLSAGAAS